VLGSDFVAKAAPDGYTIVVAGTASHALAKIASAKLPYDPLKDFRPIAEYAAAIGRHLRRHRAAITNLAEFIAQSKSARTAFRSDSPCGIGLASLCPTAGVEDRRQA